MLLYLFYINMLLFFKRNFVVIVFQSWLLYRMYIQPVFCFLVYMFLKLLIDVKKNFFVIVISCLSYIE